MDKTVHGAHWDMLLSIAHETLGINTFKLSGKASADFRVVSVDNLAQALEAAYDAGLMVGYSVSSSEGSKYDAG
ncbi:MAG TPA: hypothetical protein VFE79_25420 [Paraburkholderia sp.]|jgi:hypothetical protein|nr:hypothetical protein [Paraburkholderia sp.]